MSALPFTPLTITPRPEESRRVHSPSQREEAEGRADPDSPDPLFPSSPVPLFSPSDHTTAAILDDFAAQDLTLRDIAEKYETTLESLTLWLARPDIKERLFALESACATRARLVVANNLAAIANKLLHLLTESKLDHESTHRVPANTHHAFAARMQSRESARKTANLLLRIARYVPPSPTAALPRASSPCPRGEVPESARAVRGRDAHQLAAIIDLPNAPTNFTLTPPPQRANTTSPLPASPSDIPHPKSDISPNPTSDIHALTCPKRERAGLPQRTASQLEHESSLPRHPLTSRAPPLAHV